MYAAFVRTLANTDMIPQNKVYASGLISTRLTQCSTSSRKAQTRYSRQSSGWQSGIGSRFKTVNEKYLPETGTPYD